MELHDTFKYVFEKEMSVKMVHYKTRVYMKICPHLGHLEVNAGTHFTCF